MKDFLVVLQRLSKFKRALAEASLEVVHYLK